MCIQGLSALYKTSSFENYTRLTVCEVVIEYKSDIIVVLIYMYSDSDNIWGSVDEYDMAIWIIIDIILTFKNRC